MKNDNELKNQINNNNLNNLYLKYLKSSEPHILYGSRFVSNYYINMDKEIFDGNKFGDYAEYYYKFNVKQIVQIMLNMKNHITEK